MHSLVLILYLQIEYQDYSLLVLLELYQFQVRNAYFYIIGNLHGIHPLNSQTFSIYSKAPFWFLKLPLRFLMR